MTAGLLQRWRMPAGEAADALCETRIRAWDEPQRVYHDQSHLIWLRKGRMVKD